jgi:cytochrome b561
LRRRTLPVFWTVGGLLYLRKGKKMKPLNYSISQRVLHWGMALLIFFNLIFTEGMEIWHRAAVRGQEVTADMVSSANIHAYVGIAILVLVVMRLVLRVTQGVPDLPSEEPAFLKFVAKATHGLLYLLLIAMPLAGIAAYYFGFKTAGDIHADILKVVLWALIVLHVAGALVQKFYFKSDVLDRMTKGVKS